MLFNVVATVHFDNETRILVNSVFTAPRRTPTSVLTSLTSVATTKKGYYTYQPNNCQMMVLRSSTIVLYFHSFMNLITTLFFPLPTTIPVIQKPTWRIRVLIQSNLQIGHVFVVLHTWTTVLPASLLVTSISMSWTMKLIYGHRFLARRSID
jgi:hypothetical protein